MVYIPGRAFSVFTGADGSFRIDNVPAGTYTIVVERGGASASVQNVVVADAAVTLEPIAIGTCAPACVPSTEVCDGRDNNCDGTVDEGEVCGPACIATGPEVCDNIDNDCDGQVDEQSAGAGMECGTGFPGACGSGITVCTNGVLSCNGNVTPGTIAEVCDGQDNDCDGAIDEGNPGGGTSCNTGLPGACAVGARACSNGALVCVQTAQPSVDVCDGIDNNCDGVVDNGCQPLPNAQSACQNGACGIVSCSASFGNCDNSPANGCETSLMTTVNHCGACGNVCNLPNAVEACAAGQCTVIACNAGFSNCDGNIANGCETSGSCSVNNNDWKQWQ